MIPTATRGELMFEETGDRIDVNTKATEFCELPIVRCGMIRHDGPRLHVALGSRTLAGQAFHVTVVFEGNAIRRVELTAIIPGQPANWSEWTMESDMATKALHESWAARALGRELEVKPFFTPNRLLPFERKPETAMYAQMAWGQVVSWYDSKGNNPYMTFLYGEKDPV